MPIRTVDPRSPEYNRDYDNGWRTGENAAEGALDRADGRNVSHAWYDGYMDAATGRDKWTWRQVRREGYDSPEAMYAAHEAAKAAAAQATGEEPQA